MPDNDVNEVDDPKGTVQPVLDEPEYGDDGMLTYEGMKKVIEQGGGVSYGSAIITDVKALPTKAQLAKGNAKKTAAASAELDAQIAALQAQKAALVTGPSEDDHPGHGQTVSALAPEDENTPGLAKVGDGDTAGADGDMGDPGSDAAKKLAERQKAADEAAKKRAAGGK